MNAWELRRVVFTVVLGASIASPVAVAQMKQDQKAGAAATTAASSKLAVHTDIFGKTITNDQNVTLGTVDEIIIDRTGAVNYLIVSPSKDLAMGNKQVAVPWHAITVSSNNNLMLSLTKDKFTKAPTWSKDQMAMATTDWDSKTHDYYGLVYVPAQANFAQLDINKDNKLSKDEAQVNRQIGTNFKKLDKNSDGSISQAEFSAFEQVWQSGSKM